MNKKENIGISIIVCFYNSVQRLEPTIKSIISQKGLDQISWELILVDNASKDGSMTFAQDILKKNSFEQVICAVEDQPGLNYARKKGIESAQYEYVLFCDDDNWLEETYLKRAFDFLVNNENYGIVGGNGEPVCEVKPPSWFDHYAGIYATGCRSNGDVTNVYGAGMTIRKSLISSFIPQIEDRKGNALTGGGDTEICDHITQQGYKIKQLCDNRFKHFIPKSRLTLDFLKRTAYGRGFSKAQITYQRNNQMIGKLGIKYRVRLQVVKMLQAVVKINGPIFLYNYHFLKGYYGFYRDIKLNYYIKPKKDKG
jgi:glycosyltransferase involved in cell wall biosynthesis